MTYTAAARAGLILWTRHMGRNAAPIGRQVMATQTKPRVYVIGTGGSISFVGRERTDFINYSYDNKHFTIQELLDRVPEGNQVAEIRADQFLNLRSTDGLPSHWLGLAQRILEFLSSLKIP